MNSIEKKCLSCRHYRPVSLDGGLCRVQKEESAAYPSKKHEESCLLWKNCGQQYYIRVGWLRRQQEKESASL